MCLTFTHFSVYNNMVMNSTVVVSSGPACNGISYLSQDLIENITVGQNRKLFAWSVTLGLLCFIGIVTNILALIAIWPKQRGFSAVPVLVFHLVAVSLLDCVIVHTPYVITVQLTQNGRKIPSSTCQFSAPFNTVLQRLINWSEVALAVKNRFVALFFPHH